MRPSRRKMSCISRLSKLAMPATTARAQTCTAGIPSTSTSTPAPQPATEPPCASKLTVLALFRTLTNFCCGTQDPASNWVALDVLRHHGAMRISGKTEAGSRGSGQGQKNLPASSQIPEHHTNSLKRHGRVDPCWWPVNRNLFGTRDTSIATLPLSKCAGVWCTLSPCIPPPRCRCKRRTHHCAPTVHNHCRPGTACGWHRDPPSSKRCCGGRCDLGVRPPRLGIRCIHTDLWYAWNS